MGDDDVCGQILHLQGNGYLSCTQPRGHIDYHQVADFVWKTEYSEHGAHGIAAPGEFGQYSELNPQPIDVMLSWKMPYLDATALKYLSRHRKKGGKEDLEKAMWFIQKIIDTEYKS